MNDLLLQSSASHEVRLWIPSTRFDEPITLAEHESIVFQVETKLSQMFGGATSIKAMGSWFSEDAQKLIREPITIVFSFASELSETDIQEIISLAKWIANELNQEAVLIRIDERVFFISPD